MIYIDEVTHINQYAHDLVVTFHKKFPNFVQKMKETNHNAPEYDTISVWHPESDVWTHTMMVLSHIRELITKGNMYKPWKELLIAALLHDVGKPMTRMLKEDKQKAVFYGHAGVSTFKSVNIIQELDPKITDSQKIYILQLINNHQLLYQLDKTSTNKTILKVAEKLKEFDFYYDLYLLRKADSLGTIAAKPSRITQNTFCILSKHLVDFYTSEYDKTKPTMVMMVGLPCSGKDYYIKHTLNNIYNTHNSLSRDALIMEAAAKGQSYNEAFKYVDQKKVDELHEIKFRNFLNLKKDFILNRTNLTYKGRKRFIDRAKTAGFNIKLVVMMTSLDVINTRNIERVGKTISSEVMKNMMKSFEMPYKSEGQLEYIF